MKDELGGKIMTKCVGLIAKTYSYLMDDGSENKQQKAQKLISQKKLKFENYKNCLEATQLDSKIKYLKKNKINNDILRKIRKNSKKY